MKIQDLDYEFEYLKGKQNAACDFLSRYPENMPSETEENEVNIINAKSKHKCKKNKVKDTVKENKDNYCPLSLENIKRKQKKDEMCVALINYFVNDVALPDKFKTHRKEIDNFYYDLDEEILCRIVTSETNRNQTSIIPVLPQNLIIPAFKYFHSDIGGHLGVTKTFQNNIFTCRRE